jgi:hypothetical protein
LLVAAGLAGLGFLGLAPAGLGLLLAGCNPFAETDFANCVVVEDEAHFTGEWLKHERATMYARIKITKCEEKDRAIDGGDGPKSGRVRWAVCLAGPDCDESGMH